MNQQPKKKTPPPNRNSTLVGKMTFCLLMEDSRFRHWEFTQSPSSLLTRDNKVLRERSLPVCRVSPENPVPLARDTMVYSPVTVVYEQVGCLICCGSPLGSHREGRDTWDPLSVRSPIEVPNGMRYSLQRPPLRHGQPRPSCTVDIRHGRRVKTTLGFR